MSQLRRNPKTTLCAAVAFALIAFSEQFPEYGPVLKALSGVATALGLVFAADGDKA